MVNTVGSYENKYWNTKWRSFKEGMQLTSQQKSLVIGSMLGDGTMRMGKGAVNANFKIDHGLKQRDYVLWKYEILKDFVPTEPKLSYRTSSDGIRYEKSWWFRTIRHPIFTEIYHDFYRTTSYKCGTKIVPRSIIDLLDPLAIAVWIMDDGSYNKSKLDISTYSFTLKEIEFLQTCMQDKFNIQMSYFNDRGIGYRMYCNMKETQKLIDLINPYIHQSMTYKIGFSLTP